MLRALLWFVGVASSLVAIGLLALGIAIWSDGGLGHGVGGGEFFLFTAFWAAVAGVLSWACIHYARKPKVAEERMADAA